MFVATEEVAPWLELAKSLSTLSLGPLLILILIGGYFQKWVWGYQLKAMTTDRDFWREYALSLLKLASHKPSDEVKP